MNPQGYRTTWTHDAADRVKVQYLGNNTRASYSYDDANQLLKLANIRSDATTISSFDYAYDSVGNRTRVVESDGIRVTWSYDGKYQLMRERRSGANAYDITYSYDATSNRRMKCEDAIRTTYAHDKANQLRYQEDNTGRTTFTFDANGNQRIANAPLGGLTTITWDFENRLTKAVLPTGSRGTFAYDSDGNWARKEDESGIRKFVWDMHNILLETDAGDTIQVVYTMEPATYGRLISQHRGATSSFYHFDGLGSTDRLSNASGMATDGYVYTAFGVVLMISGLTANDFKYVGQLGYYESSALLWDYIRARWLDPRQARFPSRDVSRKAISFGRYPYVASRPTYFVDPTGLQMVLSPPSHDAEAASAGHLLAVTMDQRPKPPKGGAKLWFCFEQCFLGSSPAGVLGGACVGPFFWDLRGSEDNVWDNDEWAHCIVSCKASKVCGRTLTWYGGHTKECLDCLGLGTPDPADLAANREGRRCAGWETFFGELPRIIGYLCRQSCEDCCDAKYPRWK